VDIDRLAAAIPTVMGMNKKVAYLLAQEGVVRVADHPALRSTLSRLRRAGRLESPLPGVFVSPGDDYLTWLRAVTAWAGPEGVLHAQSAASLWLPEVTTPNAHVAHPRLLSRKRVVVRRRLVSPEFVEVTAGVRHVSAAYAAAELAGTDDGRAVCEALRQGRADRESLGRALAALAGTHHQRARVAVVAEAVNNPWSYAELRLQRILRQEGILDWVANQPLRLGSTLVIPDIRFRRRRLVIEFDGRQVHDNRARFLADRERLNLLEAFGYHVLRFGWEHLDDPDYVVGAVRSALRRASAG
jgi:very-short-patch-repair endonuclease